MGKLWVAPVILVVLGLISLVTGCQTVALLSAERLESTVEEASDPPILLATLTAVMDKGSITYSLNLENKSRIDVADLSVAVPVPSGVTDVKMAKPPGGSSFRGIEDGSALWQLDLLPGGISVGHFSYTATVPGATPGPVSASVRWTAPRVGTTASDPTAPTLAGLPRDLVKVSDVIPSMGERWAKPEDLPLGPLYGVYAGRILFLEYMISQADFVEGVSHPQLPGNKGLPPIDHLDVEFQPNGHEGNPVPHYDIHAYMVSHAEHGAIR